MEVRSGGTRKDIAFNVLYRVRFLRLLASVQTDFAIPQIKTETFVPSNPSSCFHNSSLEGEGLAAARGLKDIGVWNWSTRDEAPFKTQ